MKQKFSEVRKINNIIRTTNIKKYKKEKGITLVALVITIVILIILSTITIGAIFGDEGLIEKAELAKELAEKAIEDENNKMNKLM